MAGLRFQLDLYINEDPTGTPVAGVKIPDALAQKVPAIRNAIRILKSYSSKINEGKDNEEMSNTARFHICYHKESNKPCGDWQEI